LGENCLALSVQASSCSRCYVGITMQMAIVSAIITVPHSSPSPAKMEEHEYSLYITGKLCPDCAQVRMVVFLHVYTWHMPFGHSVRVPPLGSSNGCSSPATLPLCYTLGTRPMRAIWWCHDLNTFCTEYTQNLYLY